MFAGMLIATSAWAAQQPTLGELALKEQQRRKALKAAGKVLTKEDLPPAAPVTQPPTSPAPGGAGPAAPSATADAPKPAAPSAIADAAKPAAPQEEPRDEAWWRQRITRAREELRRNEMFAEALQTRINALTSDFTSRDDPYQRARVADDRQKAMAEFDRVRSEIELQKKKIGDIEEEARRASVPPGWLR